jgi:hypothetical protein
METTTIVGKTTESKRHKALTYLKDKERHYYGGCIQRRVMCEDIERVASWIPCQIKGDDIFFLKPEGDICLLRDFGDALDRVRCHCGGKLTGTREVVTEGGAWTEIWATCETEGCPGFEV